MIWRTLAISVLSVTLGLLAGCEKPIVTHKLVVTGNEHSVPLYADEHSYLDVSHQKQLT